MQFLTRKKKETEAAVVSGVAKPRSAFALTVLNICNAIKLEKWIACVNTLTVTNIYIFNIYIIYNFIFLFFLLNIY